jgi:hypothetical protein
MAHIGYRLISAIRLVLALAAVCAAAAGSGSASTSTSRTPLKATFVGDSVAASITYVPTAQNELKHGLAVTLDLKVCRRLVQPSCPFQGVAPSTALQAVRGYGRLLGKVLIVKVGYNEGAPGYAQGIDEVMRAALADGAHGVVWVTLRETSPIYVATNAVIRSAGRRWPQLVVADWNAFSAGRPWFGSDGLHLNTAGATALAGFLRPYVWRASTIGA